MVAEHKDPAGVVWEFQLKGAGPTPYSRGGDGRAVLRSTIREYLCSHALHCLNIPTTLALAMVTSNDEVQRETVEKAAIVLRVAPSFIRFGHFEVFASRGQINELKNLANFTIENYYPELSNNSDKYLELFKNIVKTTANLVAKWQAVGFCHGVLNTDNMSILGLTLDYGPFSFMDEYNPDFICNHSDYEGRYSYISQPSIGGWNLERLAEVFSMLVERVDLDKVLTFYHNYFMESYLLEMGQKLGFTDFTEADSPLLEELLNILENRVDWTIFWRSLSNFNPVAQGENNLISKMISDIPEFKIWIEKYLVSVSARNPVISQRQSLMLSHNPKYILRNYLLEKAIAQAEAGDFGEIDILFNLMSNPYMENEDYENYANQPPIWAKEITVSCSS